ncbi:hypothetical protein [Actinospica robiniae]|uniref:hypothetical protein n=1 Tax=Actinospica robiniae TaxID=304901 RepID=UPI001FDF9387|nr:hypothetical protein [Actinospica robiniae]
MTSTSGSFDATGAQVSELAAMPCAATNAGAPSGAPTAGQRVTAYAAGPGGSGTSTLTLSRTISLLLSRENLSIRELTGRH